MSWCGTKCRRGRLDLIRLVWFSLVHIIGPDLAFSDHAFVFNAELVDLIIIAASQECTFIF